MTNPQDIIGIVKELQELKDADCEYGDMTRYMNAASEHFPRIAQALLIAVEALDKLQEPIYTEGMRFPDGRMENKAIWTAKQALSRIRSL